MRNKKIVSALLALVLVLGMVTGVFAAGVVQQITASLNPGITVTLDGAKVPLKDANGADVYPITYNGTTYLPVRAVAGAIGKSVNWDGPTQTVKLGQAGTKVYFDGNNWVNFTSLDNEFYPKSGTGEQYKYTPNFSDVNVPEITGKNAISVSANGFDRRNVLWQKLNQQASKVGGVVYSLPYDKATPSSKISTLYIKERISKGVYKEIGSVQVSAGEAAAFEYATTSKDIIFTLDPAMLHDNIVVIADLYAIY